MYRCSHSQQAQTPTTLARFQLAKFSYATTSIHHRGPVAWSHVFGNGDIVGIFERYTTFFPGSVHFGVRNNQEALEQIAITDLIKEFENQIHSRQGNPRPSFAVVVKLPCLAVKYPQRPGYVRRFQIKFCSDRDFYSALAILSEINCPFSESNVSSIRPLSRSASSLSKFGHIGAVSSLQSGISTATRTPTSNISIPPHRSTTSSSFITNSPSATIFPSSSSSSTTIDGTSRPFSSTTLNSTHRLPFETMLSTSNIPPASTHRDENRFKQLSASTDHHDHHDLDLPPKRVLPFSTPGKKRSLPAPKAADSTSPKTSNKDTTSSLPEPKKRGGPRASTGKRKSKAPQEAPPRPLPPCPTTTISPPNQATATTIERTAVLTHDSPVESKTSLPLPTPADLAQYISNPTKERTATLENWICSHLEDDNFLQLCVDVEGVWARFAVGK